MTAAIRNIIPHRTESDFERLIFRCLKMSTNKIFTFTYVLNEDTIYYIVHIRQLDYESVRV